jgi:hypothetical protein
MHTLAQSATSDSSKPGLGAVLSHGVLVAAVLGLWLAPSVSLFLVAWAVFFTWATVRVSGGASTWFATGLMLACGAVPVIPLVWPAASVPLTVLAAAMATGVVPFNLWFSALERRVRPSEFQVVLLAQPGLVWLHRLVSERGDVFHGDARLVLLFGFVASALLKTGLGLVRKEPQRALSALVLSQSMLALAGAVSGEAGWSAARLLWLSMALGSVVLQGVVFELKRTHGVLTLAVDHGLAASEPGFHRLFVTMGWLMVGVPGGVAFFAEDLLFHSIVEESGVATMAFLLSAALNAVVFYRVYIGLFAGPSRVHPVKTPSSPRRRVVMAAMLLLVVVMLIGGLWPATFL